MEGIVTQLSVAAAFILISSFATSGTSHAQDALGYKYNQTNCTAVLNPASVQLKTTTHIKATTLRYQMWTRVKSIPVAII
jgi:hypothetical protein